MQDITPAISKSKKIIESYGAGAFKVSGKKFEGNILILPDSVAALSSTTIENCNETDLKIILQNSCEIEILLVGSGKTTSFFNDNIESKLKTAGINVEYMDTGSAARTYNVLLTEERKVAVVLIAV